MSSGISIAGMGWVTPLGCDLDEVWDRMMKRPRRRGETALQPRNQAHPSLTPRCRLSSSSTSVASAPPAASPISYFSVAAGLAALQNAGVTVDASFSAQNAVIFAVSSGTRRLHSKILRRRGEERREVRQPDALS